MNDILVFDGEPTVLVEQVGGDVVVFDPVLSPVEEPVADSEDFLVFDVLVTPTHVVTPVIDFVIVDGAPVTTVELDTGQSDFMVIETRGPQGPRGQQGLQGLQGLQGPPSVPGELMPSGAVVMFGAAPTPPDGFLVCDGSSVLRAAFPTLFAAIGTAYGSADEEHFNLPNFNDKVPFGNVPEID
jgi:hypothetical protein